MRKTKRSICPVQKRVKNTCVHVLFILLVFVHISQVTKNLTLRYKNSNDTMPSDSLNSKMIKITSMTQVQQMLHNNVVKYAPIIYSLCKGKWFFLSYIPDNFSGIYCSTREFNWSRALSSCFI